ncbi:ATP-grasp domain-containing protein [Arthrobacter pigmenti]
MSDPGNAAERRRALIVSTGRDRGALAAARSLRHSGWSVGVGTPDGGGMLGSSHACDARYVVPRPRGSGAPFIEGVNQAAVAGSYDVVFGGGDDWMAALATYQSSIPARIAHPESAVVHAALDKMDLTKRALKAGLAAPHTETATAQTMAAWRGPVIVKCRAHWSDGQTRPLRIEARLFPDIAAARPQIDLINAAGAQPVLQQPVRGGLSALIGIFHDGRLHGRVQQVSPRLWPTPNGASARAETVAVDEVLAARAEKLLADLGWWGLVELQFLTGDDGEPHLIDLNGRFFGSMALSNAARPGLSSAWGRLALGEPLPELPDAPAGVRYAWLAGDMRRAGRERRGGLVNDIADTLRWSRTAHHSVWNLRDLGPTWYLAASRLHQKNQRAEESSTPPV